MSFWITAAIFAAVLIGLALLFSLCLWVHRRNGGGNCLAPNENPATTRGLQKAREEREADRIERMERDEREREQSRVRGGGSGSGNGNGRGSGVFSGVPPQLNTVTVRV
jgi:hypothetical protein